MNITIYGQVPSQKNAKRMAINKRTGKPFPVTEKRVKEWQDNVHLQLTTQFKGCADSKVTAVYTFFVKDDRRRDIDNMIASVNDALVKAGLLADDDWQHLAIGAADAEIDRSNPRCEIWMAED
jgi:Holliday junction resolvase RusA-like endonuclease